MKEYELIKFTDNELELDVNVSPEDETVWLTKDEMSQLFERDRTVISRHISNIFKEKELEEKSNVHFLHVANSDKPVAFYNLDVIISVGYRVKSNRGVIFRKWANNVLKQYLIKGYVVDDNRTLVTNENYVNLIHKVDSMDDRLKKLENDSVIENDKIFFDGEYYDALSFLKKLFSKAQSKIILIDPYSNLDTLDYFKVKKDSTEAYLYTSDKSALSNQEINAFNNQYGKLKIHINNTFHDRFIILDDKELYHLGTSLNYAGKKTFAVTKMDGEMFISSIMDRLK